MQDNHFQIVPISPKLGKKLYAFFREIKDNEFFHPHSFDYKEAHRISHYGGDDIYAVIVSGGQILAYGFVHGFGRWDDVCLGLIVRSDMRGMGLAKLLVSFLHTAVKLRGVKRIRLHVNPKNKPALNLYKKMGYKFNGKRDNGEMIGICTL